MSLVNKLAAYISANAIWLFLHAMSDTVASRLNELGVRHRYDQPFKLSLVSLNITEIEPINFQQHKSAGLPVSSHQRKLTLWSSRASGFFGRATVTRMPGTQVFKFFICARSRATREIGKWVQNEWGVN